MSAPVTELVPTAPPAQNLPAVAERPAAIQRAQIPVFSFDDLHRMADVIQQSGIWGRKSHPQCLALLLTAQAKGMHPMEANERFHVMENGKITAQAWHIQATFQQRGGRVEFHQSDNDACSATFISRHGTSLAITWDIARATLAGLAGKGTWAKHPAQMLRARCIAEGIRAVDPEAVAGMYLADEAEDFEQPSQSPMQQRSPQTPPANHSATHIPPSDGVYRNIAPTPSSDVIDGEVVPEAPDEDSREKERERARAVITAFADTAKANGYNLFKDDKTTPDLEGKVKPFARMILNIPKDAKVPVDDLQEALVQLPFFAALVRLSDEAAKLNYRTKTEKGGLLRQETKVLARQIINLPPNQALTTGHLIDALEQLPAFDTRQAESNTETVTSDAGTAVVKPPATVAPVDPTVGGDDYDAVISQAVAAGWGGEDPFESKEENVQKALAFLKSHGADR